MKAIVCPSYGSPDILEFQDVTKPSPKDNEVLVKIHAAGVNAGDWHLMRADPFLIRLMFGFTKPKQPILGGDFAGQVTAVGKNVSQFKVGDEVFGASSKFGAFAEYVAVSENTIVSKPTNMTFEQVAAVPTAAVTALQGLRDHGKIKAGQKVLINGASGGVGSFAVQIAKALGAEVTGVCSSGKMNMVRSLGADHVIDYKKEDFTKTGKQYDLILGVGGYHPLSAYKRALKPNGIYVMTGGKTKQMFETMSLGSLLSMTSSKKITNFIVKINNQDLLFLTELLEQGKLSPVIDKSYPLTDVPKAIAKLESGKVKGKLVIKVASKTVEVQPGQIAEDTYRPHVSA
ncbi:MAG: NAD(P)-dependent alcohol dehydrogenase [Trueperaceae bacterium]|nr:NAD(P)-dependent alcohol dehydrogenase [Trueperaceae bacterium]